MSIEAASRAKKDRGSGSKTPKDNQFKNERFKIIALEKKYVNGAVSMHLSAFKNFFLSQLGRSFLHEFYEQAAGHEQTVGYVAVDTLDRIVGVSFGMVNPSKFYKDILKRRWWMFGLKSLWPVLKSPRIIPRLIRALGHEGNIPPCALQPLGVSLSTAVHPDIQGVGIAIALMRAVNDEFVRKGVNAVYLTTDADNNDRVRGFYSAMGWDLLGYYRTPENRRMCWYLWQNQENEKKEFHLIQD